MRYKISGPLGCWMWTGALTGKGYPAVKHNGRTTSARRVYFELDRGPMPVGYSLVNTCGERACVRPDHQESIPAELQRRRPRRRARPRPT